MNRINDYVLTKKRHHPGAITYTLFGTTESLNNLIDQIKNKCFGKQERTSFDYKTVNIGISTGDGETDRVYFVVKLVSDEELINMQKGMSPKLTFLWIGKSIICALALYGFGVLLIKMVQP